jgi:hypothetical protein
MGEISQALATIFLGVVGLWVGNNYRRQMRNSLTPQAAGAYARLWEATAPSTPADDDPLSLEQRAELAKAMHEWYFRDGSGMYLPDTSRRLFFVIVSNLTCEVGKFAPASLAPRLNDRNPHVVEKVRGCASKRQMSLLRTQLKNDMAVYYSTATFNYLRDDERELLASSGIRPGFTALPMALLLRPARTNYGSCYCDTCVK